MVDRNPAPQGFEDRCMYCGRPLMELEVGSHLKELQRKQMVTARFCNEDCAEAYKALLNESWEESDEIDRAGAT